eukprot:6176110-Pleurochrysis_carterae.AAC.2
MMSAVPDKKYNTVHNEIRTSTSGLENPKQLQHARSTTSTARTTSQDSAVLILPGLMTIVPQCSLYQHISSASVSVVNAEWHRMPFAEMQQNQKSLVSSTGTVATQEAGARSLHIGSNSSQCDFRSD